MSNKANESRLDVFFRDTLVGRLWLDERRRFVFEYDREWLNRKGAVPLSLSLPLRKASYTDDAARPFFANLLPESEIRKVIARQLGISEQNDFAMLQEIGGECAGAVSVLSQGSFPQEEPGYRELGEEELHKVIAELPRRPFLVGEKGVRLSLAGAQNKLPVYMEGNRIFLPTGNSPSTHILKPPIQGLEETVENEAFCMMLAASLGLSVPKVTIRRGQDKLYIVERFDRERDKEGKILRLHQEDFCQALGVLPDQKYESEGGPSLARCFGLLKEKSISPAADQKPLLAWVVFNFLVGSADAHAKNLAVIFTPKGPRLAPFYDLICTRVYPGLSDRLAMRIGGENRPQWIQPRHWERFSSEISIKFRLTLRTLKEMAQKITSNAGVLVRDFSSEFGESNVVGNILEVIKRESNRIAGWPDQP
jgi:serine/threonine-protein kinase HipA